MTSGVALPSRAELRELRTIPGVGEQISLDLWHIGICKVRDLAGRDPEELYRKICAYQQAEADRCMLYVMRCAVYYASTVDPDPKRLKWWVWKDVN